MKELLEKIKIEIKRRQMREHDSYCYCSIEYERAWLDALNWVKRQIKTK